MKILLTGATGMLGSAFVKKFGPVFDIISTSTGNRGIYDTNYTIFNLQSEDDQFEKLISKYKPEVIIHCAAITNVKLSQTNKEIFTKVNIEGTEKLAKAARNIKLIYISTDAVYGTSPGPHKETDERRPENHYAYSKSEGEKAIIRHSSDFVILRTTPVGFNTFDPNFGLTAWILNSIKVNIPIDGYSNVMFSPISTWQLSDELAFIISHNLNGIFNLGSSDPCSKYNYASKLISKFYPDRVSLVSKKVFLSSQEYQKFDQTLDTDFYSSRTGRKMPSTDEVITNIYNNIIDLIL